MDLFICLVALFLSFFSFSSFCECVCVYVSLCDLICFCHLFWGSVQFFFFINLFIYLFLAALGLHCCALAFSSCSERGLLFVVVHGFSLWWLLIVEHGL